MTLPFWTDIDQ